MKLSIIMPVYNEEYRIRNTLQKIISYLDHKTISYEIIVVNDGSIDNSLPEILKEKTKDIQVVSYKKNMGKGYAVKTGVLTSKGDLIFLCDADLSMPISELGKFLHRKEDIVIGSRAIKNSKVKTNIFRKIAGRFGNFLISLFIIRGIEDTQCGFKLFNKKCKKLFEKQTITGWGFDFEILFLAEKYKYSIKEIPITWIHSKNSKIKWTDYPKTLLEILKVRINNIRGVY